MEDRLVSLSQGRSAAYRSAHYVVKRITRLLVTGIVSNRDVDGEICSPKVSFGGVVRF